MITERDMAITIGRALAGRRGEQIMWQWEVAEHMGVPQSVVSRVERGYHIPTLMTLHNHCNALDWTLKDLFTHVHHLQEETMSEVVDVASRFAERRAHAKSVERFNQETERRAAHLEAGKCCTTLETGNHPEHDFHLCLRAKGHKGYHMDKITGLNWKWGDDE